MNETTARLPYWYWGLVAMLVLIGAGVLASAKGRPVAILNEAVWAGQESDQGGRSDNPISGFEQFLEEVSQLSPAEQRSVWQSLRQRSESLAEQTFYAYFSLPEVEQQELLDRVVDKIEERRRLWRQHGFGFRHSENSEWPVREVSRDSDLERPFEDLNLEERLSARRDAWEDATAQSDAMRAKFLRMVNERRHDRGIPEPFRHGG